ncbi:MAG: hypothetical protein MAG715_00253 [Methanonatronarchaeales archaeon]|nr:hypothetical protein [Methanonatronarchaeales archaeon]
MTPERGEVWWGPALFKGGAYRPWLTVSHDSHPFSEEECIGVGLTTTSHREGLKIEPDEWVGEGMSKQSYASPWYCTTLKHRHLDRKQGTLVPNLVSKIARELVRYVEPGPIE